MDIALTLVHLGLDGYRGSVTGNTRAEYESLGWPDGLTPPTWEALEAAWPDARKSFYGMYRRPQYPPMGDGLDALAAFLEAQRAAGAVLPDKCNAYLDACLAVKAAHPKAEGAKA